MRSKPNLRFSVAQESQNVVQYNLCTVQCTVQYIFTVCHAAKKYPKNSRTVLLELLPSAVAQLLNKIKLYINLFSWKITFLLNKFSWPDENLLYSRVDILFKHFIQQEVGGKRTVKKKWFFLYHSDCCHIIISCNYKLKLGLIMHIYTLIFLILYISVCAGLCRGVRWRHLIWP